MTTKHKWSDAVFITKKEEILEHYNGKKSSCLYILGRGFDPRMVVGLTLLHEVDLDCETLLIDFSSESEYTTQEQNELIASNIEKLKKIDSNYKELKIPDDATLPIYLKQHLIIPEKCNRVIVDISSMPQSVSFNIIKQLLKSIELKKQNHRAIKMDIVACENSSLDDAISPTDLGLASFLVGFDTFSNDLEADVGRVPIWFPLLGRACGPELDKLQSLLAPEEICPVLPFPSRNPRRSEEIFLEMGEALFSELEIDRRDILYVAEQNVLDIYDKLHEAIQHYNKVFKEIGEPKFYVSLGSSKLIGLGALLVHLELSELRSAAGILFAQVSNNGYKINMSEYDPLFNKVCLLCLEDDRYEW